MTLIYKIAPRRLWDVAETLGVFVGAPIDQADGYIHFSTAEQVLDTAAKHFGGQHDLLLITVVAEDLGATLKWEPARGGALFPHLHGDLPLAAVRAVRAIPVDESGTHRFDGLLP